MSIQLNKEQTEIWKRAVARRMGVTITVVGTIMVSAFALGIIFSSGYTLYVLLLLLSAMLGITFYLKSIPKIVYHKEENNDARTTT